MIANVLLTLVALVVGGWMIFDGVHVILTGKYFGPEKPGPWSGVVAAVALDPFKLGIPFVVLGSLWLVFLVATILGHAWAWYAALLTAILTLWYLPIGTGLSVLYIILLLVFRSQLRT